jgi:hypothetical protein
MGGALDDRGRDDQRIGSVAPHSLERRVASSEVLAVWSSGLLSVMRFRASVVHSGGSDELLGAGDPWTSELTPKTVYAHSASSRAGRTTS